MPPVGPHLLTCFQSAPCFSSLSQNSQVGIRPRYPDRRDPISLNNPGSQGRDQEGERGSQQRLAAVSADERDAVICTIAGADFLAGRAEPPPAVDRETAEKEGWIWVRRPGESA